MPLFNCITNNYAHLGLASNFRKLVILSIISLLPGLALAAKQNNPKRLPPTQTFGLSNVLALAQKLAQTEYKPPVEMPKERSLTYEQYRAINYRAKQAIWGQQKLPFQLQMFLQGSIFKFSVPIHIIEKGQVKTLNYAPDLFEARATANFTLPKTGLGFSGLRLHYPLNTARVWDELVTFQGASYFRSLGKNKFYGLSARGLAINTAASQGEEFPIFRSFWVEKPTATAKAIKLYALLDSPSVSGAYQFVIQPGNNVIMDITATLFPRVQLDGVGLAPATSMFLFSGHNRYLENDYRPQVHDSDGLLMVKGNQEKIWRPLINPIDLQVSTFSDENPRGFGLIQRERDFSSYQDLEANYENRTDLFVQPQGNWGKGAVVLVEIPSTSEINDNIVAFWRPKKPLAAGQVYNFAYRLHWGQEPTLNAKQFIVKASRTGRADLIQQDPKRLFVIDYVLPNKRIKLPPHLPTANVTTTAGKVYNLNIQLNPRLNGYRLSFQLDPQDEQVAEIRANLEFNNKSPYSAETWLYRWTTN